MEKNIYNSAKLIVDDDNFQVYFEKGENTGEAVISFTGIGNRLGGIHKQEFQSSLSGNKDIYYIVDINKSWYSSCDNEISIFLKQHVNQQGYKNITTIGNSMGGSGAICFANLLSNCSTVIAFVPQSSIDPSVVIFDRRYIKFSVRQEPLHLIDFIERLSPWVTYHLIVGSENYADICHSKRFYEALPSCCHVYEIPGGDHNVAQFIKRSGYSLKDLVSSIEEGGNKRNAFMDNLILNI
jgi:hypothetical protein